MSSTYTDSLRLELQGSFENNDVWGTKLNTVVSMIEQAVAGISNIDCTAGGTITLTTANSASDQARCAIIALSGTPAAAFNIVVPNKPKIYIISNGSGQTATVKTASGSGVAVPTSTRQFVFCDGSTGVYLCITGASIAASAVAFTPTGGFVSTDVQALGFEIGTTKANLSSPVLTGIPTGPTPALGTNNTQLATTAFVYGVVGALSSGGGFPSGTRLVCDNDVAPAGWAQDTNPYLNDMALRVTGDAARYDSGVYPYSTIFSYRTSDPTAITAAQMPGHAHTGVTSLDGSHTHNILLNTVPLAGGVFPEILAGGSLSGGYLDAQGDHQHTFTTDSVGAGAGHSHTMDMRVRTRCTIIIVKI